MGRNLGPLNIKDSYEGLVQISGSQLTDGSGSLISDLNVTASDATLAQTASLALALEGGVSLQSVLDTGNTATEDINLTGDINATTVTASLQGDVDGNASTATTASYALTASVLEGGVSLQTVLDTGNSATQSINLQGDVSASNIKVPTGGIVYTNDALTSGFLDNTVAIVSDTSDPVLTMNLKNALSYDRADDQFDLGGGSGGADVRIGQQRTLIFTAADSKISGSQAIIGQITGSSLIVNDITYPTTDGTDGQALVTDGSGSLSFADRNPGLVEGDGAEALASALTATPAKAEGDGSIAIGDNAVVTGSSSSNTVAIGKDVDSKDNSVRNVIIGYNAYMTEANRNDSVIIGANANGYQEGVAIGADSFTIYQAVAVGKGAYTNDNFGVAVGAGARTNNNGGIAIGSGSLSDGDGSIAIGKSAHATAAGDVVINNGTNDIFTYDSSNDDIALKGSLTQGRGTLTNTSDEGAIIGANNGSITGNTTGQAIAGGDSITLTGRNGFIGGGSLNSISVLNSGLVGGRSNGLTAGQRSFIGGGVSNKIQTSATDGNAIIGGLENNINDGSYNAVVAGSGSVVTHDKSVVIGGQGLSTSQDDEVVVPNLSVNGTTEITGSLGVTGSVNLNNSDTSYAPTALANKNTAYGQSAGRQLSTGQRNTLIGGSWFSTDDGAGSGITTGQNNVVIGNAAGSGNNLASTSENVIIGAIAGYNMDGSESVFVGYGVNQGGNSAEQSVLLGKWAGYNTTGGQNVAIGWKAGFSVSSGVGNIFIGPNVQGQGGTAWTNSNYLAIGSDTEAADNLLYGDHGSSDRFLQVKGDLRVTGSATISEVLELAEQDPLPTGAVGQLAVSASALYFHNGTSWSAIS